MLTEIAARPANFGYGLGHALRMAVEFVKARLDKRRLHGKCIPEDKNKEEAIVAAEECILATANLQQHLSAVEMAEEENFDCLLKENISPWETRRLQQAQRPNGGESYLTLFSSVGAGPYRTRNQPCEKEALKSIVLVKEAEKAENEQREKCRL